MHQFSMYENNVITCTEYLGISKHNSALNIGILIGYLKYSRVFLLSSLNLAICNGEYQLYMH